MGKYRVAYATGSRADYGIVKNFLRLLDNDKDIEFSVLVTGSHLEDKFGHSVDIIRQDGFKIDLEIPLNIENDSNANVMHCMATALDCFGNYFENNKFDLLIILGDRYEMMAVAIAAAMQRIPILHLHGGEVTYGNYDEFIRHSITKMSQYHFTSTEEYRKRVIQLGEDPKRVFYLGALGAENCCKIDEEKVIEKVKELTGLRGRWEIISETPKIILDTGHNPGGLSYNMQQLKSMKAPNIRIIIGMVSDKDIKSALNLMPKEATFYFTKATVKRALDEVSLYKMANEQGLKGNHYPDVGKAYEAALKDCSPQDIIYIGGSNFIVGDFLSHQK